MTEDETKELEQLCIDLVSDVRAGTEGAWERLVSSFERLVWAVPSGLGFCAADCEEVFQLTWISLFGAIDRLERPGGLVAWLVTTARRHCWRLRRKRGFERFPVEEESGLAEQAPGPMEQAAQLELRLVVQRGVEALSERCRDLLERLYFARKEESYAEISRRTGMPVGSIGPTRMRCLAELARRLEAGGEVSS